MPATRGRSDVLKLIGDGVCAGDVHQPGHDITRAPRCGPSIVSDRLATLNPRPSATAARARRPCSAGSLASVFTAISAGGPASISRGGGAAVNEASPHRSMCRSIESRTLASADFSRSWHAAGAAIRLHRPVVALARIVLSQTFTSIPVTRGLSCGGEILAHILQSRSVLVLSALHTI